MFYHLKEKLGILEIYFAHPYFCIFEKMMKIWRTKVDLVSASIFLLKLVSFIKTCIKHIRMYKMRHLKPKYQKDLLAHTYQASSPRLHHTILSFAAQKNCTLPHALEYKIVLIRIWSFRDIVSKAL